MSQEWLTRRGDQEGRSGGFEELTAQRDKGKRRGRVRNVGVENKNTTEERKNTNE